MASTSAAPQPVAVGGPGNAPASPSSAPAGSPGDEHKRSGSPVVGSGAVGGHGPGSLVTAPASPPASPPVADEHDRVSNEDAPAPALELAAVPVLEAEGGLNLRGAGGVEDVARESGRPLTSGDDGEGGPVEMATINPNILPAEHWVQQGLPPDSDDADSSFGSDGNSISSSTASLSESILEYRTIHGRTFHSEKITDHEYWNPNDDQFLESMDIIHHMHTLVLDGKLFIAPIGDNVQKVLDVGTGTGMWAIDFADTYPSATVIGTDISPTQPAWLPPNLRIELDDATKPWTYAPDTFDFIHMRYLFGSISDWAALFGEAYRCARPGGWVESYEPSCVFLSDDGSIPPGSPMHQWGEVFVESGRRTGRTFTVVEDDLQRRGMVEAGFGEVGVWEFKVPLSSWPADRRLKEIGGYSQAALEQDIEGYVLFVWTQIMGWSVPETQVFIAHLRRQVRNKNVHGYFRLRVVYAQKPLHG